MELNIDQIKEILPHRYPMLLVDKILDYEPGRWARGIKCVSANEEFFNGHFPQKPVMPGVLIIEALAQTGAVAILTSEQDCGKLAMFGGIKNARFKTPVCPGDVLELYCELTKRKGPIGVGQAAATVNGKVAAEAEFTFAVKDW